MMVLEWINLKDWLDALQGIHIVLLVNGVIALVLAVLGLRIAIKAKFVSKWSGGLLFAVGVLLGIYLLYNLPLIEAADWAQIFLVGGLVAMTGLYGLYVAFQARASTKMAEEMREQRIMSSRPVIVQKDVCRERAEEGRPVEYFSHFEIYNAGNSPTIGLEILLLDKEKRLLEKQTEPLFLRAAESMIFSPSSLFSHVGSTCYLLCQYQSVFSHGKGQIWYQTWLPFEPIKSQRGDVIVKPRGLKFCEVSKKGSY